MIWQDIKAYLRGERRIKGQTRGRCYTKKDEPQDTAMTAAKGTLNVKVKITRADGSVEEY